MSETRQEILTQFCWQLRDRGEGATDEIVYDGDNVVLTRTRLKPGQGYIVLLFVREMFGLTCPTDLDGIFSGTRREPTEGTPKNVTGQIYYHSGGKHSPFSEIRGKRWSRVTREALIDYAKLADRQYDELREAHLEKARVRRASVSEERVRRAGLEALFHERFGPQLAMADNAFSDEGLYSVADFRLTLKLTEEEVRKVARALYV
jgi:hypothetical protein